MNLSFHAISNTPHEIAMGHKIWFEPVPGCDVISATANAPGFTPFIAVARHFGWDYDMLGRAAAACNAKGEVLIVTSVVPALILVPATKGRGNTNAIVSDYIDALRALKPKCLHFTHYGFLQGRFPSKEVAVVLNALLGATMPLSIHSLFVDVDVRWSSEFYNLMRPTLHPFDGADPWI